MDGDFWCIDDFGKCTEKLVFLDAGVLLVQAPLELIENQIKLADALRVVESSRDRSKKVTQRGAED